MSDPIKDLADKAGATATVVWDNIKGAVAKWSLIGVAFLLLVVAGLVFYIVYSKKISDQKSDLYLKETERLQSEIKKKDLNESIYKRESESLKKELADGKKRMDENAKELITLRSNYASSNWLELAGEFKRNGDIPFTILK